MNASNNTVILGMSGGVDSTASAQLLQRQGYNVVGATLRLQQEEVELAGNAKRDIADAKAACDLLGMEYVVLDHRDRFRREVLDYFAGSYDAGETPNPCVICNRYVKFPGLLELAEERGAAHIATGHYADALYDAERGRWRLKKAGNRSKDQSYVLYSLDQNCLSKILFPLASYRKEDIRAITKEAGLAVADKGDSQDICFVPDGDYVGFLRRHTRGDCAPGSFVDEGGNVLGSHKGIWHYTVGQRKGLGISFPQPMFVSAIDAATGKITLSKADSLFADTLFATDLCWIDFDELRAPIRCCAQIRYAHKAVPATVTPLADNGVQVLFDDPQRAVTKGQAVVFYDDDFVVGGGIIR